MRADEEFKQFDPCQWRITRERSLVWWYTSSPGGVRVPWSESTSSLRLRTTLRITLASVFQPELLQ